MAATIKDVARLTGLSLGTISKYINGGTVKPKNKELLDQAISDLDFKVNEIARGLKTNKSMTVGILVPNVENVFSMNIISNMENSLNNNGYSTLICDYRDDPVMERDKLEFLIHKMVDGIVIMPTYLDDKVFSSIVPENKPVIFIDRPINNLSYDFVCADNFSGAYRAISYLIEQGHRKIAIIGGPENYYSSIARTEGFVKAHKDHGVEIADEYYLSGDYTKQSGYQQMLRVLEMENRPSAVFVTNYEMTLGAVVAANEKGIRLRDDISFVGFDDLELCEIINLTAVAQPMDQISLTSADILLKRLRGSYHDFPQTIRCEPELVIRKTVKKLR